MFPRAFKRGLSSSAITATFPSKIPTIGVASTNEDFSGLAPNATAIFNQGDSINVVPYGTANDNQTLDVRVIGWSRLRADSVNTIWMPIVICQMAVTHCGVVGVDGCAVKSTERFADTITTTNGLAVPIGAPTDTIASFDVDVSGFEFFEFTFDLGAGTDANVLYAPYGELGQ